MKSLKLTVRAGGLRIALCLALIVTGTLAQEPAPEMPFKTVHLLSLDAALEAKTQAAVADLNQAVVRAGFPKSPYRLYKVHGKQQGNYSHLWEGTWAGRAEYDKIHNHPEWKAAVARHKGLGDILKDQIYNRFVEIPTTK